MGNCENIQTITTNCVVVFLFFLIIIYFSVIRKVLRLFTGLVNKKNKKKYLPCPMKKASDHLIRQFVFLLHRLLLCNLCNRLYKYFWKYNTISIEALCPDSLSSNTHAQNTHNGFVSRRRADSRPGSRPVCSGRCRRLDSAGRHQWRNQRQFVSRAEALRRLNGRIYPSSDILLGGFAGATTQILTLASGVATRGLRPEGRDAKLQNGLKRKNNKKMYCKKNYFKYI